MTKNTTPPTALTREQWVRPTIKKISAGQAETGTGTAPEIGFSNS